MKRNHFPLNHIVMQCGYIGRLQTLSVIRTLPGDSMSLQANCLNRMSALRRALAFDPTIDIAGFWIPDRHIYGDEFFRDFIEAGVTGSTVLPLTTLAPQIDCLGQLHHAAALVPQWLDRGYKQIWNRYYRMPKVTPEVPMNYLYTAGYPTGHSAANSPIFGDEWQNRGGFRCARSSGRPWTTGINSSVAASQSEVPVSASKIDLYDVEKVRASLKTEIQRAWFNNFYKDILKTTWKSTVDIDADPRPELLFRRMMTIQGYDVDGTAEGNLGVNSGKGISRGEYGFPRKFFPEHGTIWIMAVVRPETICYGDSNPVMGPHFRDYTSFAGDPTVVAAQPPQDQQNGWWNSQSSGSTTAIGTIPYGQYYRSQPHMIHRSYQNVDGYPILNQADIANHISCLYFNGDEYNKIFSSEALLHWQSQQILKLDAFRYYPEAITSVLAGSK